MEFSGYYQRLLLGLALCVSLPVSGQVINSLADFEQLSDQADGSASVIIELAVPQSATRAEGRIGDGQWINLGNYIEEAQDHFASDMGWVNINELVKFKTIPAMAKTVDRAEIQALLASGQVKRIYQDALSFPSLKESSLQIQLPYALAQGIRGQGYAVAILDTGVDSNHPFLRDKVVAEACFSRARSCPNGQARMLGVGAGQPCTGDCGHGTHVAGIAAGKSPQFSGVAPDAKLIAMQVFSVVDSRIGSYTRDQLQALEWLLLNGHQFNLAAINMSLGGRHFNLPCDNDPRKLVIDRLRQKGVATIIASGNESQIAKVGTPGCISSAITVGALGKDNQIAPYSNSYPYLDIVAPGGNQRPSPAGGILSSVLGAKTFDYYQGTSMAAPHVAGAWLIFKSAYPKASVAQIEQAMLRGAPINTDPRNGLAIPTLDIKGTLQRLATLTNSSPAPKPEPAPVTKPTPNQPCAERIGGILVESANCDNTGGIQW